MSLWDFVWIVVGAGFAWSLFDRSRGGLFWRSGSDIQTAALELVWPYKNDPAEIRRRFRKLQPPRVRRAVMSWAAWYEGEPGRRAAYDRDLARASRRWAVENADRRRATSEIISRTRMTNRLSNRPDT